MGEAGEKMGLPAAVAPHTAGMETASGQGIKMCFSRSPGHGDVRMCENDPKPLLKSRLLPCLTPMTPKIVSIMQNFVVQ